jgi:hypothetical protein
MTRYRVLPYRQGSRSAKALAEALGGKVLKLENSKYKYDDGDVVINWGNTSCNFSYMLNYRIDQASNKLKFFNLMKENNLEDVIPEFWTNPADIPDESFPIVCRTVLSGHSGAGIVIADCKDQLAVAPLYTRYTKKKDEYRVHVGRKEDNDVEVIAVQRKARREGFENPDWKVRNHNNGFVFIRGGVNPPVSVIDVARSALQCSGLDFGAVDVIWNAQQEKAYVLEINTAPGLEGQTVTDYANFFKGL